MTSAGSAEDTAAPVERGTEHASGELTARILDTALAELRAHGLRRTRVDTIARRAGLARATVYRRFDSKPDLVRAVVMREFRRGLAEMARAVEHLHTVEERLVEGFVTGIGIARNDPLLARLLDAEPEMTLPYLTIDSQFALAFGRDFLADQLRRSPETPDVADLDAAAEIMMRLGLSIVLAPHSCIPLDTDDDLRAFARTYLTPLLDRRPRG